jgi:hydroxymethylpyrimidine/phosphomethylpyrimidine kinase
MRPPVRPRCALSIAGSDSGGCAGVQADLETFAAFGLHGLSVLTAVTAQNTREATAVHAVPPAIVTAQLDAVFADFTIGAVKTGMLATAANVRAIAAALRRHRPPALVIDPVLVASSGMALLTGAALQRLRRDLLPLATLLTPNLPEAEALLGRRLATRRDQERAARDLLEFGPAAVLLKGGHGSGREVVDVMAAPGAMRFFIHRRLPGKVRGTGCTLAAAIAAGLALGQDLDSAVTAAESYLQDCLSRAYRPGRSDCLAAGHLPGKSTKT